MHNFFGYYNRQQDLIMYQLLSQEMDIATQVQILDKSAYISHVCAYTWKKHESNYSTFSYE